MNPLPIFLALVLARLDPAVCPKSSELHVSGNTFELTNLHRHSAVLKFTTHGTDFTHVKLIHNLDSVWQVNHDHYNQVYLSRSQTGQPDSSQYFLTYYGKQATEDKQLCFHYGHNGAVWYGSTMMDRNHSFWLDAKKSLPTAVPLVTGEPEFGSIVEPMFINTDGFLIKLYDLADWTVRFDQSNPGDPQLCFVMNHTTHPYGESAKGTDFFHFHLEMLAGKDIRAVHQLALNRKSFLRVPSTIPNESVFKHPIWSTFGLFKKDVTQAKVLDYANQIKSHGLPAAAIEIDDGWERHYGDLEFDSTKFPDPKKLAEEIHALGAKVTLWVHPFVGENSGVAKQNPGFLLKNLHGHLQTVKWWDGTGHILDFTNPHAVHWFHSQLRKLRDLGVDSFYLDAGEVAWLGPGFNFTDHYVEFFPNLFTNLYVNSTWDLGDAIQVRAGFRSQDRPYFFRMHDQRSEWNVEHGLKSMIPTALTMSLAGYPFIAPEAAGGASGGHLTEELYLRWVQATTFLPSMHFSIPPWNFSAEALSIVKKFVHLHEQHSAVLIQLAKQAAHAPIIRPMWYADPNDAETYHIADQFMVGEDILVAPVVSKGQTERSVYLPAGSWIDQHGQKYSGKQRVKILALSDDLIYLKKEL